jgi:hypothetical protein
MKANEIAMTTGTLMPIKRAGSAAVHLPVEETPAPAMQQLEEKPWKWKHYPDEEDIKGVTPDVAAKIRNWD